MADGVEVLKTAGWFGSARVPSETTGNGERRPLRILLVHAISDFSTADVGQGYARAFRQMGADVSEYRSNNRLKFVIAAFRGGDDPKLAEDVQLCCRIASEWIVAEALRNQVDLVVVTSGSGIHPDGLQLCARAGFPVAVVFTESPYEDEEQLAYTPHAAYHFTNDAASAERHGWTHLPPSYDPEIHKPYPFDPAEECDVLFVGCGWEERQAFLEQVNWRGIHLRLLGYWPGIKSRSRLRRHYTECIVPNAETARLYSSARIVLNFHRESSGSARSLNPRAYEIGACGAFQLSDWRPELDEVYGGTVPTFSTPDELEAQVRWWLRHDGERREVARRQAEAVRAGRNTFDDRAAQLLRVVTGWTTETPLAVVSS